MSIYRLVICGEDHDGALYTCNWNETFSSYTQVHEFVEEQREDEFRITLEKKNDLPEGDIDENSIYLYAEDVTRRTKYKELKETADKLEEMRLKFFTDKEHIKNIKEDFGESRLPFYQFDDELFEIQSRIRKLYYQMINVEIDD